jgi:hypothetical protein
MDVPMAAEPIALPPALPPGTIPVAPPTVAPIRQQPIQPDIGYFPLGPFRFPTHPVGLDPNATFFTYESAKERKYFEKAIEAMDTKYDGSAKGLLMFITKVEQKSDMFGWHNILSIPTVFGTLSLTDHHGQAANVKMHIT